jgi:hypothetical protein
MCVITKENTDYYGTEQVGPTLKLWTLIWEVFVSNLDLYIGYSDCGSSWLS